MWEMNDETARVPCPGGLFVRDTLGLRAKLPA
jgi:hypothetical protein